MKVNNSSIFNSFESTIVKMFIFPFKMFSRHSQSFLVHLIYLIFCSLNAVNCSPAPSSSSQSPLLMFQQSSNQVNNNNERNYEMTTSFEKPKESTWSLALPLLPFSSSSSSVSSPWTSFIALGSEDVKNIALSESPSVLSSSPPPPLRLPEDLNILPSGNETVNLYSDSMGRPLKPSPSPSFRTNIYRCDKTLAIIDYIDENRIFRCELFDLEKRLTEAQEAVQQRQTSIRDVSFSALHNLISRCQDLERFTIQNGPSLPINLQSDDSLEANRNNTTADTIYGFWRGVIPGTKWCGPGDIAKDYFDIGQIWDIDLCCRAHDHCPYRLKAFRNGYGLINLAFYTRSHCECDEQFYRCLKKSNNNLGSALGNIYFNVIQVQCFKEEEETNCVRSRINSNGQKECISYAPNGNRKMVFAQPKPYN